MYLHRKITAIVGLGMIVLVTIVVLSLNNIMFSFSSIMTEVNSISREMRMIQDVENDMNSMSRNIHRYITSTDSQFREAYHASHEDAVGKLGSLVRNGLNKDEHDLIAFLQLSLKSMNRKADRIFSLSRPTEEDSAIAQGLVIDMNGFVAQSRAEIEAHFKEERSAQSTKIADYVYLLKNRVLVFFIVILVALFGFLFGFGVYLHRRIALPLNDLWKGATEISRGNLDYRIRLQGSDDISQLAERFNGMAGKLRQSYTELENKLLDRTNDLAAIDAVALTLSQASSLREMLTRSLAKILESLVGLEPRGGVFLCNPDGKTLRLVAHQGLPPLFVEQEETIGMGECLCGRAAETGDMIYSRQDCDDPRHTRSRDSHAHGHIIIPIKSRGIVLGVVFLYPQKEFTLKPSDIQMLDTIGAQLGMAVENLRFYAEVKESSEKFWDLFENSRDILFTTDAQGTLTAVNKEAEKFTGYSKSELVGKSVLDFLTPAGAETARRMLRGDGMTARQVIEFEVIKPDGRRAFIEMSARRLFSQRTAVGYQVSARDMTEQKMMREKLVQAERLGAIGEVVITVRHEINNPLTTVIGNIELLIERYGDRDKDLGARLETVLNNALRIAEIVKQLQAIKRDKVVEYVRGVSMTDLKQE